MPPAYEVLLLNTAVPQIQAAQSGDTYVCPRDIQITANLDVTGNTILGNASTDTVRVNGYMGVGGAGATSVGVNVNSTNLLSTVQAGFRSNPTFSSAATAFSLGFYSLPLTAATAFTTDVLAGFYAANASKGAGSTITSQHGVYIADQSQGTNNYGITSLVSSGTNKWNIYASGTAANYFAGNVGIGTTSPQTQLELSSNNGAGTALNILRFNDADTTSAPDQPTGKIEFYINDATAGGTGVASYIMGHAVNTAGGGYLTFATSPNGATGAIERLRIEFNGGLITKPAANGHAVFNEDGVDADFRVESDTNTHALFVDAGNSRVGINNSAPSFALDIKAASNEQMRIDGTSAVDTTFLMDYNGGGATNRIRLLNKAGAFAIVVNNTDEAVRVSITGNVGFGTIANASAIIDAQSTTKGVRMPNMTTTQKNAIVSPAAGLIVFDTTLAKLCVYSGSAWETITSV